MLTIYINIVLGNEKGKDPLEMMEVGFRDDEK